MILTAPVQPATPTRRTTDAPTTAPHGDTGGTAPVRAPGFSATAPRELVHRAAISEVFITGWGSRGGDSYELAAQ